MSQQAYAAKLRSTKEYFDRSTRCLAEDHSGFCPSDGMLTAAQQVAHVAQTVDWFVEGASRPEGFDLDFESHGKALLKVTSLSAARDWLDKSFAAATAYVETLSDEDLKSPLPDGVVMGGAPRSEIFEGIVEYSAHHRGALTVYSRLCGLMPAMPYMEME